MNKAFYLNQVDLIDVFLQDPSAHARNTSKQPIRRGAGTYKTWSWNTPGLRAHGQPDGPSPDPQEKY